MSRRIGLFGGTFDPVHIGHLRTALELQEILELDEVRLLPCSDPYHRDSETTPAPHRLAMLQLACADVPGLVVDDRELHRSGPTYTFDTLSSLREELGDDCSLVLCMGMDALLNLPTWHRWQDFLALCHIVVACRPGYQLPESGALADLIQDKAATSVAELHALPAGKVLVREMTLLPVSATEVRAAIGDNRSLKWLVPDPVIQYINDQKLYTSN